MHRPRHSHTILNLQLAAFLLCLNRFLIPAAVILVLASVVTHEAGWSVAGLAVAGTAVVTGVVQWIFAAGGKCPLCMMPVLLRKGCSKHRDARVFAGSHRFPVALAVLFKGRFRCPYCNEPTRLELKTPAPPRGI